MKQTSISNNDDVIDSRDVIARIEELERSLDTWECPSCGNEVEYDFDKEEETGHTDECEYDEGTTFGLDESEWEELKSLKKLAGEAEGYASDWRYGETLIRDSYFEECAEELVKDIGDLPKDLPSYIENNIDWKGVAEDIQQDYTSVEFDGVTYWIR
jgi:hypothetical protein